MSNIILLLSSVIFPFPQFVLLGLSSSHMETLCQTDAFSPENTLRKQKDREQTGGRVKEKEKKQKKQMVLLALFLELLLHKRAVDT